MAPGAGFEPARGYPHRLSRRELNQGSILADDFGFRSEGVSQVESISGTFKIDHGLLREFYGFITGQGISVETAKYYVNILKRFSKLPDPLSLSKSERTAIRKYVEFMFKKGKISYLRKLELLDKYKGKGKAASKTKVYIEDSQAKKWFRKISSIGNEEYRLAFTLMFCSGARLKHVLAMLETWNPGEVVQHLNGRFEPRLYCSNGFCRYFLFRRFGRKYCYYIYFPRNILKEIKPLKLSYHYARELLEQLNVEARKIREFVEQRLRDLCFTYKIPLDAAKLILSHELASVSAQHYDDIRKRADKLYSLYLENLRKVV